MSVDHEPRDEGSVPPAAQIGFALILGLAVFGFFVAMNTESELRGEDTPLVIERTERGAASVEPVPTYGTLAAVGRAGGSDWNADAARLARAGGEGERFATKEAALADRVRNRAYAGAPPTIPHDVRQRSAAECLACHEGGLRIRDRVVSALPHAVLASCTQCHVVQEQPMPGPALPPDATFATNAFVGLQEPREGDRAWPVAPPTTPHPTGMRGECMSCHGPDGREPLRTPHPDRQSCQQCHPPSAALDQAAGAER